MVQSGPAPLRLFIAIPLPRAINLELDHLQYQLAATLPHGAMRWVRPESRHLTLRFLDAVPNLTAQALTAVVNRVAMKSTPFALPLTCLGAFPSPYRTRVLWLGLDDHSGQCLALKQRLERELTGLGLIPEKQRFTPHLTLARARGNKKVEGINWQLKPQPLSLEVGQIQLMASRLTPGGAHYDCLHQSRFGKGVN